ncbi:hypothetical protein CRM22_005154 [Opisthorchis felineus]|uniref:Rho-GAP domain-containing protein n=1 Tax=Opisthorchis felineus TaxID=147828 RepID=A0A4S2LSJ5_OPIFE|nr:hypothetical protein CRM22_005154 [Opisthorchis felineus]
MLPGQHRGTSKQSISYAAVKLHPAMGASTGLTRSRRTVFSDHPSSQIGMCSGPLRRSSTLEGRTQLICDTPSRARDSLLSRGRSPSTNSSVSRITRRNNFPNSLSDGALMKKLTSHTPGDSLQSAEAQPNASCELNQSVVSVCTGFREGTPIYRRPVTGSITLATVCSQPLYQRGRHHTSLPKFGTPPTRSVIPSRPDLTQDLKSRANTSPGVYFGEVHTAITQQIDDDSKTAQRHTAHSARRKTVNITEPRERKLTEAHTVTRKDCKRHHDERTRPKSHYETIKSVNVEKPSFTKHLLSLEKEPILIKSNGKTCEYPLNTWFVTSQMNEPPPPTENIRYSSSFDPNPSEKFWPEEAAPVRPRSYYLPDSKTRPNGIVKSNSCGFPGVIHEDDLITAVPQNSKPETSRYTRDTVHKETCAKRRAPLAPEEIMNNSSGDTESSVSESRTSSFQTKKPQAPAKQDKLKVYDLRRTTPRQLKQQQNRNTGTDSQKSTPVNVVEKSSTALSKFEKQASIEQLGLNKNPGEFASSLIRNASCRIRSTWSKLKRSNSGHSTAEKPSYPTATSPGPRRSSDPSAVVLERATFKIDVETPNPSEIVTPKTTAPCTDANETRKPVTKSDMYFNNKDNQLAKEDSSLPPGCSQWSTRLGPPPPPPVSPTRSAPAPRVLPIFQGLYHPVASGKTDQPSTPPANYDITHEWKSPPLGSAFCSLPVGDSDNLNLLTDDCVDVGELGRINYRTGSFMGRYPHPRGQQASQVLSAQLFLHRNLTQTTPTRLSPSRPLFLSPYQASSSGNTTRSAPSPSLCSMTSASIPTAPNASILQATAYFNSTLPDSGRMHAVVASSPKADSNALSFQELDPVLDRLLSDVSSIENYRSALRYQATPTRSTSLKPSRVFLTSNEPVPNGHQPYPTSVGTRPISSGSSDPGSMARRSSSSTLAPSHERLDEQLRQQITDLIHLEFAYQHPQLTTPRIETKDTPEVLITTPNQPRLSEPSVDIEDDRKSDIIRRISRYHPFRWSSGARTGTKEPRKYDSSIRPQPRIRIEKAPSNLMESGSVDRLTQAGKRQPIVSTEPTTNTTDESSPPTTQLDSGFWLDSEGAERMSLWQLNAHQLALLRKLALVQLTSLVEQYCGSRSLFNCSCISSRRLLKSRSPGNAPEPAPKNVQNSNAQSVQGTRVPEQSTEPVDTGRPAQVTTTTAINSTSVHMPPVKRAANTAGLERRTNYTGPVFGQSLESWQRRIGYPLPPAILNMMEHIENVGATAHGIFRRPGRKDRIQGLREEIEKNLYWNDFEEWQPYDVADLLKQFFRELPECLLTDKLSLLLVSVYGSVPANTQMDLLRWILLGMPDENRTVLQKLLYILHSLVRHAHITQMGASNLAVCFAPSLFRFASSSSPPSTSAGLSPRRLRRTKSGPDPKDLADQRTAQHSLSAMITHAPTLFEISTEILRRVHLLPSHLEPRDLDLIIPGSDWPTWIQTELGRLSRECASPKPKGWTTLSREAWKSYQSGSGAGESLDGLEVYFRKPTELASVQNDPQLRTWRCSLVIPESNPKKILDYYWGRRTSWDPDIQQVQVVEQISDCVDICRFVHTVTFPLPVTQFHVLRGRQSSLVDGCCAIICESISSVGVENVFTTDTAIGHIYEDHVYVRPQPETNGCRVYLLSRVDLKGHTPDWYTKHWGHTLVRRLINLRRSFDPAQQR